MLSNNYIAVSPQNSAKIRSSSRDGNMGWVQSMKDSTIRVDVVPVPSSTSSSYSSLSKDVEFNFTCIASLFLPLVRFLRVLGFCPFKTKQDPETKIVSYEFKWKTWLTFYSVCVCSFATYMSVYLIIFLTRVGFGWEFQEVLKYQGIHVEEGQLSRNLSFVSELGTRFVPIAFPLFTFVAIVGAMAFIPSFLLLLKTLSQFQLDYLKAFPYRGNGDPFGDLWKYRRTTFMIFPVFGAAGLIVMMAVMRDCASWKICLYPEMFAMPAIMGGLTMVLLLGSHAVHFMIFRTLTEIFKQIGIGIRMWSECHDGGGLPDRGQLAKKAVIQYKKVLNEDLRKWSKLVMSAKGLIKIAGKGMAVHHVLMIFINFINLCLGVFSCLSAKVWSTEASNRGYVLLMFCSWGFSVTISKAIVCEKILEQEKRVAEELRKLDFKGNVPALIQLNSLIGLINEDPTEIRFWNVMTFNKLFLLKMVGHVATYLIVLIQFDSIERGRFNL